MNFKQFLNEGQKIEITVSVSTASEANDALEDELRGKYKTNGSNSFIFKKEDDAITAISLFSNWKVEITEVDGLEDWEDYLN